MKTRILVLLAGLSAIANAIAAESAPAALLNKLSSLAGAGSRDCGSVALPSDRNAAVECAKKSQASGSAYRVAFELQGVDSKMWQGAARDEHGKLWVAFYDSDSSGGANDNPTLSTLSCHAIEFVVKGGEVLDCQPVFGGQ